MSDHYQDALMERQYKAEKEERSEGMKGETVPCGVCNDVAFWEVWDNGHVYYCPNCGNYVDKDGEVIEYHESKWK
jgi:formamidopyrimidine-DNA glycosylase